MALFLSDSYNTQLNHILRLSRNSYYSIDDNCHSKPSIEYLILQYPTLYYNLVLRVKHMLLFWLTDNHKSVYQESANKKLQ